MKKNYIEPTLQVVVCKANAMLMTSILDPDVTVPTVTPTEEEFGGEFNGREDEFGLDDDYEDEY